MAYSKDNKLSLQTQRPLQEKLIRFFFYQERHFMGFARPRLSTSKYEIAGDDLLRQLW